ncbi:hypothetical protein [Deminuibacter soli]|nr:hypothetical protein [Deminuibacter soli]
MFTNRWLVCCGTATRNNFKNGPATFLTYASNLGKKHVKGLYENNE